MSLNHHLLAKATTDSVLAKFKSGEWKCCNDIGIGFYRVGCDNTFPSPDAAFYDDEKKVTVSFEFKPPTESKRGILTGLGQSIAYLNSSNLSYLVIPQRLEDFDIGNYMTELFTNQIEENLPIGLIVYDNNIPASVSLVHNVDTINDVTEHRVVANGRFWAKLQDLPIPLFHLLLHCYYLKKIGQVKGDAFSYCWQTYLVPPNVLEKLVAQPVKNWNGDFIETLPGKKKMTFFEKKINKVNKMPNGESKEEAVKNLIKDANTDYRQDNSFNSYKKNYVTFLKHIGVIDSTGNLTEDGFKLYHLGLVNGPKSKIFYDYFIKTVLIVGHHLDLIFDVDSLFNKYKGQKSMTEIRKQMLIDYEERGMIKHNPNRIVGASSSVEFLKYETVFWNSLNLVVETSGKPAISFNWKKITEVCSLPEL